MSAMDRKQVKEYLLSFLNEDNLDQYNDCLGDDSETVDDAKDDFDWSNGNNIEELIQATYGDETLGVFPKEVVQSVDSYGGEDCGSTYWIVFKVVREGFDDTYIKFDGHYDSWNGTEWYEEFEIVNPVKKVVEVTDWVCS